MSEEQKSGQGLALTAMRVASLWLAAGALFKLFAGSPADLPGHLIELVGKGNITLFFRAAIAIELCVVALTWLKPRLGWFFLACTFGVFIAVLVKPVMDGDASCGCMGGSVSIHPILMMSIDSVLLISILATRPWKMVRTKGAPLALILGVLAICIAAPWIVIKTGIPTAPPVDPSNAGTEAPVEPEGPRFVVLDFDTWVGKSIYDADFPLTPHLEGNIEELASDGSWIFWRMTCDHCAKHLLELTGTYAGEPLVLIRDYEEQDETQEPAVTLMPEGPSVQHVSLRKGPVYVMTTPVEMIVAGGDVVSVEDNVGSEK